MFPESSGIYIAQRDDDLVILKIKGIYPSLQIDKNAFDLGLFLKTGKKCEVSEEILSNIEIFHNEWDFFPLNFVNYSVFSIHTSFAPDSSKLYLSEEDILLIRGKYYRMCQQGVSVLKIIKALAYEFKTTRAQIVNLVNTFDGQSRFN